MIAAAVRISIDPTTTRLIRDVSAGIRVLASRDGVALSESLILERARNIVMGLIGNYRIETLDESAEARLRGDSLPAAPFAEPAMIMEAG
jgi:hypothetical protein